MNWIDALILGVIQGLAEYLPISSSGHLEIFKQILGLDLNPDASLQFSVILHLATVLSTICILWKEFWPLCVSFLTFRGDSNFYYVCKILLSCIPVAIVGFCFKDLVTELFEGNLHIVGIALILTATLLYFAWHTAHKPIHTQKDRNISWTDAFIIGCSQAIAVIPGLSRSGTTIATGILLGDNRSQVAQFSFLMVIIPILGEGMLDIIHIISPAADAAAAPTVGPLPLTIGFLASFIVGCAACRWMLEIVKKGKLIWFAAYCLLAGIICLIY